MNSNSLNKIKNLINSSNNMLIVSHYDPDGDALGSSIGLYSALKKHQKNCFLYNLDSCPEYLSFLNTEGLINTVKIVDEQIDLIIFLDLNDFERAGDEIQNYMKNYKGDYIVLDHHQNPKIESSNMIIDTNASSTSIIVYKLIEALKIKIDSEIATPLLTGIVTDTSFFKNSNSNSESLDISSKLVDYGGDLNLISSSINNDKSIKRIEIEKRILNNFIFISDLKLGLSYCTTEDYEDTQTTKEDSEGFSNYLLSHKEIKIGIFIRQIDINEWKISMRSNGYIDLSRLANSFGGGGHKNASGFKYQGDIKNLINEIKDKISYEK